MKRVYKTEFGEVRYDFKPAVLEAGEEVRSGIVFVHGMRRHDRGQNFFLERLAEEGCSILSFDLLGIGHSPGQPYAFDDYNQQALLIWHSIVRAIREHIPLEAPVVLMGYSYGFSLAILALTALEESNKHIGQLIQSRMDLVVGLSPILKIAPDAPLAASLSPLQSFLAGGQKRKDAPAYAGSAKTLASYKTDLQTIETDPKVFKGVINVDTGRNVLIAGRAALEELPSIEPPCLLLFGSDDFVAPPSREELGNRENFELRVFKGGGHDLFSGDRLVAGRTLQAVLEGMDAYCWKPDIGEL